MRVVVIQSWSVDKGGGILRWSVVVSGRHLEMVR